MSDHRRDRDRTSKVVAAQIDLADSLENGARWP